MTLASLQLRSSALLPLLDTPDVLLLSFPHELRRLFPRGLPLVIWSIARPAVSMRVALGRDSVPPQLACGIFTMGAPSECRVYAFQCGGEAWRIIKGPSNDEHGGKRKAPSGHARRPLRGVSISLWPSLPSMITCRGHLGAYPGTCLSLKQG